MWQPEPALIRAFSTPASVPPLQTPFAGARRAAAAVPHKSLASQLASGERSISPAWKAEPRRMFAPRLLAAVALLPQLSLAEETPLQRHGEELLKAKCARCHAVGRTGGSPRPEAPAFRLLSANTRSKGSLNHWQKEFRWAMARCPNSCLKRAMSQRLLLI